MAIVGALALGWSPHAGAQAWPSKPIRWIVPYTGGGITDVVTRVVTQKMQGALGQAIVVDNKPGANSIIGAEMTAKAAPDGYTMVTVIGAHAANATLYAGKLSFDPVRSFVPVSLVAVGFASTTKLVPATSCWPATNPDPKPDAEKLKLSSATAKSLIVSPPSAAD